MSIFNGKIKNCSEGTSRQIKTVAGNFMYLSVLNALNVLLPLITLPYLMRTVGKANYGIYSYVYMILQYVILFATYGFNFSATKQISQCRDDRDRVNVIYNSVIASKLLIGATSIVLIMLFSHFVFKDEQAPLMFLFGMGMVAGDILTPVWLFQGMEKMKYMTLVNASSKILFTILVFVVIRKADDYYLLILLNSAGYILAGLMSLYLASRQFGMRLRFAAFNDIKYQLKEGAAVFGSTFGMNLYRNANVIILKQLVPNEVVGLYAAAEKVIKGFQSVISPVAQAIFPHLSLKFKDKTASENISSLKKIAFPFAGVVFILSLLVFLFAPWISDLLCGGVEFRDCVPIIRLMTPVILFGEINYLIGIVGLINLNRQRQFFHFVLIAGFFSVCFIIIFAVRYGAQAAAVSMSLSEVLLCILCLLCLISINKKG
jgi:PST family polysaccharide transporter